jgi:hypothetical protein
LECSGATKACVRHVDHDAEAVRPRRFHEGQQAGLTAELLVDARVVEHVVPVLGAGDGREDRREVQVADAQCGQVGHACFRVGEGEAGVELEAVGGDHCVLVPLRAFSL